MISILKGAFDLELKKRDCSIEMKLVPYGGGSMKHFLWRLCKSVKLKKWVFARISGLRLRQKSFVDDRNLQNNRYPIREKLNGWMSFNTICIMILWICKCSSPAIKIYIQTRHTCPSRQHPPQTLYELTNNNTNSNQKTAAERGRISTLLDYC